MDRVFEVVLLLALPASGKSEIRRYLDWLSPNVARTEFGLAPTIQIDDYPYVHLMRRISQEQRRLGWQPAFFADDTEPFLDDRDWGTLTRLIDEDFHGLSFMDVPARPASWLLDRFDRARRTVGAIAAFSDHPARPALEEAIAKDAAELLEQLPSGALDDSTVVMEFARGGPVGSAMPLSPPFGYRYSLSLLSPEILSRAVILYVWVTPEESRRKNRERARPGADGSILHHGVPETVMDAEYGTDDMAWLLETSDVPGTVTIRSHGEVLHIPTALFDNRTDCTSFLRAEPEEWTRDDMALVHAKLRGAFRALRQRSSSDGFGQPV